ncbi:MAG: OmpA family protein, partial [Spirochaetaceae bacterium]
NLTVTGHTADDNKPVPQSILSEERALIVKNYLMQKSIGFDLSITTVGKGATELVVKDMPIDQQEPNRRVEILLDSIEQEQ